MPVTPAPGVSSSFQFPQTPGSAVLTPPMAFATRAGVENRQPGGSLPVATGKIVHKPISALNPYQSKWTIKVKIDAKQPLKSSNIKGEPTSILSVVLVDSEVCKIAFPARVHIIQRCLIDAPLHVRFAALVVSNRIQSKTLTGV